MGNFDLLMHGFSIAITPMHLMLMVGGVLMGLVVGVLPGLGMGSLPALAVTP